MGKRGPAPKATNLKILEGNPSKRPLNNDEPQPEQGAVCPTWLSKKAKKEWHRLAPILESCGILTRADEDTLAAYCDALVNFKRCTKLLEVGDLVEDGKVNPMIRAQRNYAELLTKFGTRLGLSPSDRTSLKVSPKKSVSKWEGKIQ